MKVAESRLRGNKKLQHTAAGVAGVRVSAPSQEAVRKYIEAHLCPFCGAGPWKVLAGHTNRTHGIDRDELRELAGLGYSEKITPEDFRAERVRMGKERGLPEGARKAREAKTQSGYSVRRSSPAVVRAAHAGYRKKLERLREIEEYRNLTDVELRSLIAAQAAQRHKENTAASRAQRDQRVIELAADESLELRQIAQTVGLNPHTVSRLLKSHGINIDGRSRKASTASNAGALAAAAAKTQELTEQRRAQTLAEWNATDGQWSDLVAMAERTGRSSAQMRVYLANCGVTDLPDGRQGTTKRRTNYVEREPCTVDGCERLNAARGLCATHYKRWRNASGLAVRPPCSVGGCAEPSVARKLCSTHYAADRAKRKRDAK